LTPGAEYLSFLSSVLVSQDYDQFFSLKRESREQRTRSKGLQNQWDCWLSNQELRCSIECHLVAEIH